MNFRKTQHLLPLILGILCFSCNQGEKTKNDLEIMNLYGKVISLEVVSFEAVEKFGEIELGERKQENLWDKDSYIIFNENGDIETISKYLSNGSFDRKIIYDYNEKKQIVEINYYLKDQSLYYKEKYIYNNQNLLINSYGYNSDGELEESSSFQYDNKENATEAIYTDLKVNLWNSVQIFNFAA